MIKRWLPTMTMFLIVALAILFIAGTATHERGITRIEIGSVTADDAWIAGKNWAMPSGGVIVRNIGFSCEGYDGTTGSYAAIGDSTVFFILYALNWGADTCTLAIYDSRLDTLTAATEWVEMTISAGSDTIKLGDLLVFEYAETDTASGVLAIRYCNIVFEYDRYR